MNKPTLLTKLKGLWLTWRLLRHHSCTIRQALRIVWLCAKDWYFTEDTP